MRTPSLHPPRVHTTPTEVQGPRNTAEGRKTRTCQLYSVMNLGASDLPKPVAVVQSGLKREGGQSWRPSGMQETHFTGFP